MTLVRPILFTAAACLILVSEKHLTGTLEDRTGFWPRHNGSRLAGSARLVEASYRSSENPRREISGTDSSECPRKCPRIPRKALVDHGFEAETWPEKRVTNASSGTRRKRTEQRESHWGSRGRQFKSGRPDQKRERAKQ